MTCPLSHQPVPVKHRQQQHIIITLMDIKACRDSLALSFKSGFRVKSALGENLEVGRSKLWKEYECREPVVPVKADKHQLGPS